MINPRQTTWRLLVVAVLSLAFWIQVDPAGAQSSATIDPSMSAPEVALLAGPLDDETRIDLTDRLGSIDGVSRATSDVLADGDVVFYLDRSGPSADARSVSATAGEAERLLEAAVAGDVLVGGRDLIDEELANRFSTSARVLVLLAAVAGLALGLVFGIVRGAISAAAMAIAVYAAGNIGSQIGGDFDGTMSATALPGALAGLVVATVLTVRLLLWFREPVGADGAERIRNSITELVPELALVFAGAIVAALLVELLDPGRSPLTVVAVGGFVAAFVLAAVLAPGLALAARQPEGTRPWLPVAFPDGRDFPLLILAAVGLVLVALSLFAFGQPASTLFDASHLEADGERAVVAERLRVGGGDATNALVALKPEGTSQADFEGWAGVIVERPEVELVDVASGRFTSTGPVEADATTLLVADRAEGVAVIVLTTPPRSLEGQQVAARLTAIPLAGGQPRFLGDGAEAPQVVGSLSTIVLALIALALSAATGVYVLTQNAAQSAVTFVLRLLGGAAVVGLYRLMSSGATMAELLTLVAVVGLALGLFELEFLQRLAVGVDEPDPADEPAANPGQAATLGLVLLGVGGLVVAAAVWFGGGPSTGRFGLGLLAAVVIELLTGVLLLRPALLGQRAAFHTAARPVRIAIHSGGEQDSSDGIGPEDPTWRRVVGDLLQAEFRFQSQPTDADLDAVFVRDTPLFRQAASHHASLADAGLRIVGRSPRLRSLKTVSGRSSLTLAVTVDHPERHLVDRGGTVVGVRKPERRSGVLWLSEEFDGSFRIAESVELGSVPLPEEDPSIETEPGGTPTGNEASSSPRPAP